MPGGRPTKRTEVVEAALALALTKGYTRKAAAAAAGIAYTTMREWELAFPEFADLLEKAEQIAQNNLLDTVAKWSQRGSMTIRPDGTVIEGPGAWQAAAWILERRWPRNYGRREAVEMSGPDGGPIDHRDVTSLPDHERAALASAIRDHLRSQDTSAAETAPAGAGED